MYRLYLHAPLSLTLARLHKILCLSWMLFVLSIFLADQDKMRARLWGKKNVLARLPSRQHAGLHKYWLCHACCCGVRDL